jgi:sialate O-acetylesterase
LLHTKPKLPNQTAEMPRFRYRFAVALIFLFGYGAGLGQIVLPRILGDGAVLQRGARLKLWGWAQPGQRVTLYGLSKPYASRADEDGRWRIFIPAQPAGGPHALRLVSNGAEVARNIFFGDVWICSGQSNMELTMDRVKEKFPHEIAASHNIHIRHFTVPDRYDFAHWHEDFTEGVWQAAGPQTTPDFSAVAYFFAGAIYQAHKIPVGLINAAVGGSPAEAWMSEEALRDFPELWAEMQRFKNDSLIAEIERRDADSSRTWHERLNRADPGVSVWHAADLDDSGWSLMNLPGYWGTGPVGAANGSVWIRKNIFVPSGMTGKPGTLWMGRIVDADSVFLNGQFVGATSYQYPPRRYAIDSTLLAPGQNTLSVRVVSYTGRGGLVPGKPYFLAVGQDTFDLKGEWRVRRGAQLHPRHEQTFVRWKPGGLFNRMIAPLTTFKIKGVLWYQGESNTRNPAQYAALFPALIKDWRTNWRQGNFPFLFVQLANFSEPAPAPAESSWAALRQAQLNAQKLPRTAMAVAIDAGEWNDIHPVNKKPVGERLALAARRIAYRERKIVYAGPSYRTHRRRGNKIIIRFHGARGGLLAQGPGPLHFAVAGADGKFAAAQSQIRGSRVWVWSPLIKKPEVVRYAWADNPAGAKLFNAAGLPASPFTTGR